MGIKPKVFILDVDGVLTDGGFYYSETGKVLKKFGPDDNDALNLLSPYIEIRFVSGDKRGFKITQKRINDMKFPVDFVSTNKRIEWIKERYNPEEVIYMGDGIFDYVTKRVGGKRAVAEACFHIMEKFFEPYNLI